MSHLSQGTSIKSLDLNARRHYYFFTEQAVGILFLHLLSSITFER
jgi:hypothetical protein